MSDIHTAIQALGAYHAREALAACGEIGECSDIAEIAIVEIRDILRMAGDPRADLPSLGYRADGRDLMRAYAIGWDLVASDA